jgi:hypothetical protein
MTLIYRDLNEKSIKRSKTVGWVVLTTIKAQ